jgi:hypothetical protein
MGHSSVAGGVKGNRICLSSGVPSADAGTVDIEAENPFSSFIARSVMKFVVCIALLMREVSATTYEALSRGSSKATAWQIIT